MPGPFYFSWANANEPFDELTHLVESEEIVEAKVEQDEGDFAAMTLVIRNPQVGLLKAGRKQWGWLSWDSTWEPGPHAATIIPLFYGRIVGIPTSINQELVTLEFTARPFDFAEQKEALAASLRVLPYFDPVFIAADRYNDPDVVLEARSQLWSFDRITHEVGISDLIVGEDGLEEFQESEIPYDSVQISFGQVPLRLVSVTGAVDWTQAAVGSIDVRPGVVSAMSDGLLQEWPKTGARLDGGWRVVLGTAEDISGTGDVQAQSRSYEWRTSEQKHNNGDTMSISQSSTTILGGGEQYTIPGSTYSRNQSGINNPFAEPPVNIPVQLESQSTIAFQYNMRFQLVLAYDAARARGESVTFVIGSNMQAIITDPGDQEVLELNLTGNPVDTVMGDGSIPIGIASRRSYFQSDRGRQSIEYLILLGRANLVARSRAVEIDFACRFERAIALTTRKNAMIHDYRLPGGSAIGKIKAYSFSINGGTGRAIGNVKIACAIGYGGSVAGSAGTPGYVEDGYVEEGYHQRENEIIVLGTSDITYGPPVGAINDDGINFPLTRRAAIVRAEFVGSLEEQKAFGDADDGLVTQQKSVDELENMQQVAVQQWNNHIKSLPVTFELELVDLTKGYNQAYTITVGELEIPKQIDLEAA